MRRFALLVSVAALAGTPPAFAQPAPVMQTMPVPTPDADALAGAMRRLAENPRDLDALLTAGELSLRVGDASGAASLFKRAEQVDPANGRVKAGMAGILVRSERPGEALRYFGQAEGFGLDTRRFASDRGLAYDLIGEQERAQRDYRSVLKAGPDDETVRRYALSLGISGKKDAALEQIDTLLRKGDRGAWRARAFILAMNGDTAGATKIATSMIPGMARQLQPFFTRLATLGAADRAFAVHFGEVGPTPERLADARLTPALAPLPAEARPATQVAAVALPELKADARKRRREQRRRGTRDRVEVASAAPRAAASPPGFGGAGASPTDPVRTASRGAPARRETRVDPAPLQRNEALRAGSLAAVARSRTRPVPPASSAMPLGASPVPVAAPASQTPALISPAPVQVAAADTRPPQIPVSSSGAAPIAPATTQISTPAVTPPATAVAPPANQARPRTAASAASIPAATGAPAPPSLVTATASISPPATAPVTGSEAPPATLSPATSTAPVHAVASTVTPVSPRMSEDSILAKIIAGISIPGYELGVGAPPPPPEIVSATAVAPAQPAIDAAAAERKQAEDLAAKKAEEERAALAEKKRADAKALAAKKAADAKALAAKKAADEKALAAKQAAEEKKAAKADPPRIWVQVAGGAYQGDLPKAWAAVRAKASALSGRQGYATPLRATNRVVTGPFKTNDEAQALVNTLGKQGVSAFTFTSTAGQKVTRLPAK